MPELPEVETTKLGITPHIIGKKIQSILIRQHRLRWPVPKSLPDKTKNKTVIRIERRGKYLLLVLGNATEANDNTDTIIIHLGMSGSLRICPDDYPVGKHDHIDFIFSNKKILRFNDPRKFGCVLWTNKPIAQHKLFAKLGPEPLDGEFNGAHLYQASRKRKCSIKTFIMNSHIVVGVGNIYASESLFLAGINPKRKAGSISLKRYDRLTSSIRQVLNAAIKQGGTTLRNFSRENGQPGYFAQKLLVYGRAGEPCKSCSCAIKHITQQQRSTFYCSQCQK